jgi:hypothetical protein
MEEQDFYQKIENKKFILFKLFIEKFPNLYRKNINQLKGKYLIETVKLKSKIITDLKSGKVKYETIESLMEEENGFLSKIIVLCEFNEKEANNIMNIIKGFLKKCTEKFDVFDKILEFYTSFYSESKRKVIELIKNSIKLVKQKMIKEIIDLNLDKFVEDPNFKLNECLKESENIKYKYSLFFMPIYREKYQNEHLEKTEDEMFHSSIEALKDSFTRIINQKTSKEPFFEINYVETILRIIQNKNINLKE